MSDTYVTTQGEAWDQVALKVYGSERYAGYLMECNYSHLDTFIFSAGVVLQTPALPEETASDMPEWRAAAYSGEVDPYG